MSCTSTNCTELWYKRLVICDKQCFFLIQSLHSLTANLKKAEKVEKFFSLKRVWDGGGMVEKGMLQRIYNGSHIHRDWFSAGHQCTGVNYLGPIAERPNDSNPKFQWTIYFSSYRFLRAQYQLCFDNWISGKRLDNILYKLQLHVLRQKNLCPLNLD